MHARSLLIAPVIAVSAALLVGAIIQTGQQARAGKDAAARSTLTDDASLIAERDRIDAVVTAARACDAGDVCTDGSRADRYEAAVRRLNTWPPDQRFTAVRAVLAARFEAAARLHREFAAADADGRVSLAEQLRVERSVAAYERALEADARARRDAGFIDQSSYRAAQEANERSAGAMRDALDDR